METNNCISCGKNFHSLRKSVKKSSISAKLVRIDRTVKNVVEQDLGVHFTPDQKNERFLYQSCIWTISNYAKPHKASNEALVKLKKTAQGPTYLAKKLRSPVPTPRKLKKNDSLFSLKGNYIICLINILSILFYICIINLLCFILSDLFKWLVMKNLFQIKITTICS